MTNSNNDIEELEELLSELEGQEAQIVTPYSEEDDAVTRLMDAPLGDQDWMVQVTALDRRMMSTNQLLSELQAGKVSGRTLVWRTGMDDWMPMSRIDELSRASAAPLGMSAQRNSSPRAAFPNLAPPPPPPQPSQPLWSSAPSAPLPPPPSAMSPPFGMAPGVGLPPPPLALQPPPPPPIALTPPPPAPSSSYGMPKPVPVSAPPPESMSHGNTTRPVAVDFSDMPPENDAPLQSKRWVMALSAVAILAVFVTVYSLSSGGGESEAKQTAASKPQAVSALQPASKEKSVASASVTAAPAPKPAANPAPSQEMAAPAATAKARDEEDESEASSGSSRQTAQARYNPRSEYRRRSRGGSSSEERESARSSDAEERAKPAPAAAAPSSTARSEESDEPANEPAAAVADEVDEPPKSTSKSSGNTFNREAAKAALDEAAAQAKNCRPQGGPSGTGQVQVRYEPSGKVSNVTIMTSKFDNTTAGSCVRMLFRRAKVPEFTGAPVVVVNKSFEIP